MRALTVFVALAAVAATLAEALPWLDRHPLAVLLMVPGLIGLVGRHCMQGRHARPKGVARPLVVVLPGDDCNDGNANGDGCDGGGHGGS